MPSIDVQVNQVVKSTNDYRVVVWEGSDEHKTGEYAVVNINTGVHEASTPLLPQALEYLEQLQTALTKMAQEEVKEKAEVVELSTVKH